jgi:hypothetical protein
MKRQTAGPPAQPAPPRRFRYRTIVLGIIFIGLAIGGGVACHQLITTQKEEPTSAELDLCRRFQALKNAHDSAADDLLGPAPVVPTEALSPEEADRLHAEFFLRGDYRVVKVRPEKADAGGPDARFILVLKGGVASPRIPQTGPNGTDVINRTMSDPDVVVRVVDGKIRAVLARLHDDENAKPMSEEEQRLMREQMEEQQRRQIEAWRELQRPRGNR